MSLASYQAAPSRVVRIANFDCVLKTANFPRINPYMQAYKVLIVEDDIVTAELAAISLKKVGLSVQTVDHGDEALAMMKKVKPHVVVLDLELPGQNGVQILQQMQLDPELRDMIVIAHTAHADADDTLGFSYFAQYQRSKNAEPIMVEKVKKEEAGWMELRYVIARMLGEKYGSIPKALSDWIESNPN